MLPRRHALLIAGLAALASCRTMHDETITDVPWGTTDGAEVRLYTLRNEGGMVMKVTSFGAIITELHVPDRDGKMADIVLGHDDLESYVAGHPYFGCIAGRYANRIAHGKFTLDGQEYRLARNNGEHHLHGGDKGFDAHVWNAETFETVEGPAIRLRRHSPDGEEGYPGNLDVTVTYTLTHENELHTEITATTDAPTICNLAQHTYWNLAGHDRGPVTGHVLQMMADHYVPVDAGMIPLGHFAPVAGTPFDFTQPKAIGKDLAQAGGDPVGYDHDFVLRGAPDEMKLVCRVNEPTTGRVLELHADQPGCQFYGGNFLDGTNVGKGGAVYEQYGGFCLETQHHPDSPNHPDWPSVVLRPGETYHHAMVVRFLTD